MELIGLLRGKIVRAVKKCAHREQPAFAMSNNRDAPVILLEVGQRAIKPCRFLVKSGHVAKERGFKSIKDEVVVAIEARVLEQLFWLAPGVDVITNEPVDKND